MRYLVLSADYAHPSLKDDSSDDVDPWLALPTDLVTEIEVWNKRYQAVIAMSDSERSVAAAVIHDLDEQGLELTSRIRELLQPAKVRYYSEGLMRYPTAEHF